MPEQLADRHGPRRIRRVEDRAVDDDARLGRQPVTGGIERVEDLHAIPPNAGGVLTIELDPQIRPPAHRITVLGCLGTARTEIGLRLGPGGIRYARDPRYDLAGMCLLPLPVEVAAGPSGWQGQRRQEPVSDLIVSGAHGARIVRGWRGLDTFWLFVLRLEV